MNRIDVDTDRDTLVFMGDYIDRGDQSYEVVQFLIDLKKHHPNAVFLKGNHEEMLERYLSGADRFSYLVNGGQQTLESYWRHRQGSRSHPFPASHLDFLTSLSLFHETDAYIFVHAGLRENVPLEKQTPEDLLWIRRGFIHSTYDFGKTVIFGHTHAPEPLVQINKIGIDTGAVYGNKLTCLELPKHAFHQV